VIAAAVDGDPASKDVAAALVTAAGHDDPSVRVVAAAAVGRLDPLPPDAVAKLVELAKSDSRTAPRVAALKALAAAGPKAKGARGEAEAIAAGGQPGLALLAKVAVSAMDGDVAAAAAAVRAGLTDPSSQTREAAAAGLALLGPTPADLPALLKLLKDANPATREAAARCAGRLGPAAKEAVPLLVPLLDAREGEVRLAAVEALGEMGAEARPAVPKLMELAGDARISDPAAGPAARRALEKIAAADKK
jgi:HEAT repeat protein